MQPQENISKADLSTALHCLASGKKVKTPPLHPDKPQC